MARERLITKLVQDNKMTKVYYHSDFKEYRTKFYVDGAHLTEADSFTDDKTDAMDTAKHWVNK